MRRTVLAAAVAAALLAALAAPLSGCTLFGAAAYKTGQAIKATDLTVTVKGVRFARKVTGFYPAVKQPAEGSLWAFVDIDVANTSNSPVSDPYKAFAVSLVTAEGKIAADGPAIMANGPSDFHNLGTIQALDAGQTDSGSVAFYISEGATLAKLKLSGFGLKDKDVEVDLGGVKATAPEESVVTLGKAADVGGLEVTVHRVREKSAYSYRSGILRSTLTPEKGTVFMEVDMTVRNLSVESSITMNDLFGNEIVKGAPDSPTASRVFVVDAEGNYASPLSSIGMFREEMLPKPLWWNEKPLKVGQERRAWMVFQVPANTELQLQTRMPRLGPPVLFALK